MKNFISLFLILILFNTYSQNDWNTATSGRITYASGKVGIGTTSPATALHVSGTDISSSVITLERNSGGYGAQFKFLARNGSSSLPNNRTYGVILFSGATSGFNTANAAKIQSRSTESWNTARSGSRLEFFTTPNGSLGYDSSPEMIINHNGNVGIGTTSPSYALDVSGTINASNILVNGSPISSGGSSVWTENTGNAYFLTGNVGIGTSNPTSELEIQSSAGNDARLHLDAGSNGDQSIIRFQDAGQETWGFLSNYPGTGKFSLYNYQLNSNAIVVDDQSNIGIGTSTPTRRLDVNGNVSANRLYLKSDFDQIRFEVSGEPRYFLMSKTKADNKALALYSPEDGGFFTYWKEGTGDMIVNKGRLGIGTTTPTHKLEVNGTIRSKEVKVEASPWPDYVFEEDYNLRSLEETEAYIQKNKHLPEIPSAEEMEANGVQLGEMNRLLLQKIEELTLHQIEMMKLIKKQQEEIEILNKKK